MNGVLINYYNRRIKVTKDDISYIVIGILILIIFNLVVFGISVSFTRAQQQEYERGYLDACKDFHQGKMKYDLIEKSDGTKEWIKIKK